MVVPVNLPQETLEEVIDYLHDDRQSLLRCSTASRKLVPVCRFHLFSEVTLESNRLCRFLELLDVPWSSFANTISKLIVTGPRNLQSSARAKFVNRPEYVPEDNSRLRERLAGVKSVRFMNLCPGDIPVSFWRLLEEMKAIKAIEAHRVAFRCPSNFFGYLSSLPLLETISITRPAMTSDSRWEHDIGVDHISSRLPGNLVRVPLLDVRRLSNMPAHPSMGVKAGQAVLGWLLNRNPMPIVHSLRFNIDNNEPMTAMLKRYFDGNGSTIRKLWITLPHDLNTMRGMPMVDFSSLSEVRSLHIEGMLMSHQSNATTLESFFRSLFTQLFSSFHQKSTTIPGHMNPTQTSPPLEKISISITLNTKGTYSFFGMPEYTVLQPLSWCKLPGIIEQALEPFPDKFEGMELELMIKSTIEESQMGTAEEYVRAGVWKRWSEKAKFHIAFLQINGVDAEDEDSGVCLGPPAYALN